MERRPDDLEVLWRRGIVPDGECPTADVLARGAAGDLPHAERAAFVVHIASCESCAGLVRLRPELKSWADRASARAGLTRPRTTLRAPWLLAAAAAVALGVGLVAMTRLRSPESASYRTGGGAELRSLLEPDRPLPRAAFRLRWAPGPAGSRYSILVARENLAPIARAENLAAPEFLVEERLLADLPSGSRVIWKVRASLPGSPALSSPSFVTSLE